MPYLTIARASRTHTMRSDNCNKTNSDDVISRKSLAVFELEGSSSNYRVVRRDGFWCFFPSKEKVAKKAGEFGLLTKKNSRVTRVFLSDGFLCKGFHCVSLNGESLITTREFLVCYERSLCVA